MPPPTFFFFGLMRLCPPKMKTNGEERAEVEGYGRMGRGLGVEGHGPPPQKMLGDSSAFGVQARHRPQPAKRFRRPICDVQKNKTSDTPWTSAAQMSFPSEEMHQRADANLHGARCWAKRLEGRF